MPLSVAQFAVLVPSTATHHFRIATIKDSRILYLAGNPSIRLNLRFNSTGVVLAVWAVLSGRLTRGQRELLDSAVLSLANVTGIHAQHALMVRHFYTVAAPRARTAKARAEIAEVLRLIRDGETFADYENWDDLASLRARRAEQKGGAK